MAITIYVTGDNNICNALTDILLFCTIKKELLPLTARKRMMP